MQDQSDRRLAAQSVRTPHDQDDPEEKAGPGATFPTNSMCHATGLRLVAGRKYRIRLDMEDGPEGDWFDKGRRVDVAGFAADDARHYSAAPLKRWWRENWFQPIARIGEVGNYEHVLLPADPLRIIDFKRCRPRQAELSVWEAIKDIPTPATPEFKNKQLQCDLNEGRHPNRNLISDITANATGELFLYVNDAVLTLPALTHLFYRNNSGRAKVTVTRILADEIIAPPPAENVQVQDRNAFADRHEHPGEK